MQMTDPLLTNELQPKSANHSPLMRKIMKASANDVVNFCPHGCGLDELDENGHCYHLVGFTTDKKKFEPMVKNDRGRFVVRVRMGRNAMGKRVPILEDVLPGDKLVRITTSYRVYRNVSAPIYAGDEPLVEEPVDESLLENHGDDEPDFEDVESEEPELAVAAK